MNYVNWSGDRHLIQPGTEILGGAFLGRHAIAVDFEEKPEPYEFTYERFEEALPNASEAEPLEVGLAAARVVRRILPFSRARVINVLRSEADQRGIKRIESRDEIGLSRFAEEGGGICQHQTLLTGALLRLVQKRQEIGGEVSIGWPLSQSTFEERHTWIRYTKGGQRIIIDDSIDPPAIRLENPLQKKNRIYLLPGELEEFPS